MTGNSTPRKRLRGTVPGILPGVADDEAHVSVARSTCRGCPESSAWEREVDGVAEGVYAWQHEHAGKTGHRDFYLWTATRSRARVVS